MQILEIRNLAESSGQLAGKVSAGHIESKDPFVVVQGDTTPLGRIRTFVPVDRVGSVKKLADIFAVEFAGIDFRRSNLVMACAENERGGS